VTNDMDVLDALRAVFQALQPLDDDARARVIASLQVLVGGPGGSGAGSESVSGSAPEAPRLPETTTRPPSLVELLREKTASTGPQRITLFAYYRDRYQGLARFSRRDLEPYFAQAKESPPGNYDRDFVEAVRRGWLH